MPPHRQRNCFSLIVSDGRTWDFIFQSGTPALWKNALELLVRRGLRIFADYPLKVLYTHLWLNCAENATVAAAGPAGPSSPRKTTSRVWLRIAGVWRRVYPLSQSGCGKCMALVA